MKRLSILLIALFAVVVCANLPAAGNPGNGGNGGNGNNGGNQNTGVLNSTEKAELLYIREEEKLARDVYIALYEKWHAEIFITISQSEQRHMDIMLKMLDLYSIDDPVGENGEGVFENGTLASLYTSLVDRGYESLEEALFVGVDIELIDIVDLEVAIANTDEQPLIDSYNKLLAGSFNHLAAFVRQLNSLGIDYESEYLDIEDFETDLGANRNGRGKR